ncbi:hypothetical protein [Herbiconiux liangxiaofengii]|uniref:hypothetical protein n=1 Tax=Herbiconiux liangxiaofengii TaxID=3342795 RepID=UPI0035B6E80E
MDEAPFVYATDVVRVFPDYAGSVIWFSEPLPYPETRLMPDLIALLQDWEGQYYAALDDDLHWRASVSLQDFSTRGLELARAVSVELDPRLAVEYRSFEDPKAIARLRSEHPATNPAAEAAFLDRADRARAEWAETRASQAARPDITPGWYARSPRSGAIFRPR